MDTLYYEASKKESKVILVCFPWAGGNQNSYRFLDRELREFPIKLITILSEKIRSRFIIDNSRQSIDQIANYVLKSLMEEYSLWNPQNLPITFLGHSFGAIIAYEVLSKLGKITHPLRESVKHFTVSGSQAPQILDEINRQFSIALIDLVPNYLKKEEELIKFIIANDGLPEGLPLDFLLKSLTDVREDYRCFESYSVDPRSREKLDIEITAIMPLRDSSLHCNPKVMMGWQEVTSQRFRLWHLQDAEHFYLLRRSFIPELVKIIAKSLE
jgi:surfactin synthase thioesterase subunit